MATPLPVQTRLHEPVATVTSIPIISPPPNLGKEKKINEDGSYEIVYKSEDGISYKIEYYNESNSLQYSIEYLYDYDGRIVGVVKKDKNGNIID